MVGADGVPTFTLLLIVLIDALAFLYIGYRDYRDLGFEWIFTPLFLVVPILVVVLSNNVLAWMVVAAEAVAFAAMKFRNYIGLGDILGYVRVAVPVAVMFSVGLTPLLVLFAGIGVGAWAFIRLKVSRHLCRGYKFFSRTQLVTREAFRSLPFVFPPNVSVESDDETIAKAKERILKSNKSRCLEAYVGVPLLSLFSAAYLIMAVVAIGLYVLNAPPLM